jgi:uncharacterized protein YjbI with pentapeptide repeats
MTEKKIAAVLAAHKLWLEGKGGERARLNGASLTGAILDGAILTGAILNRANLTGANLDGARLNGASLNGAILTGANLDGARLNGAILTGANLDGARLNGASLNGAKINNDKTAVGVLRRATRSDGWEFFLWHCEDGFFIKAGCRFFTLAESRKHWKKTRGGTRLGDETMDILAMFAKAIKRQEAGQ